MGFNVNKTFLSTFSPIPYRVTRVNLKQGWLYEKNLVLGKRPRSNWLAYILSLAKKLFFFSVGTLQCK